MQIILHDFPTNGTLQMTLFLQRSILFLFRTFSVTFDALRYYILFSYFNNVVNIQQISFHTEYTLFHGNRHCSLYGTHLSFFPFRDSSMGVIHERFYIVSADGVGKGMNSAICTAYGRQWEERSDCLYAFPLSCRMRMQFPRMCAGWLQHCPEVGKSHAWIGGICDLRYMTVRFLGARIVTI